MQKIAVIDYGMGNLRSVAKALERVADDAEIIITNQTQVIINSDKVVLPGVGSVAHCMTELDDRGLIPTVKQVAAEKPFLGICLGMQLLFEFSEENNGTEALGILKGSVKKFQLTDEKVPHMGWNSVHQTIDHPLWTGIKDLSQYYFVHSYFIDCDDELIVGSCHYGGDFCAVVAKGGMFATQFHPEKSQKDGLQLLKNFSSWNGLC